MYAPILLPADLDTVLYPEIQDEITRGDTTKAQKAINAAIQEAKMYLTRYDIIKLFGDEATAVAATYTDEFLESLIKDIALFRLTRLANPNILDESAKEGYDLAIGSLKRIQQGLADPRWPYQDNTGASTPASDQVTIHANPKRNNYY